MWDLKEYRYASSPEDAVALLRKGPGRGMFIAGGTDLLLFPPACDFVVDVSRAGIDRLAATPDGDLFLGAAATLHTLTTDPLVTGFAGGAVSHAAAHCGNRPVRSTATLGGNLCNALPSADMAPVLIALDATCYIADVDNQESIPLVDFFTGPRRTVLGDRLLVGVALPAEAGRRVCRSRKLTRSAEDISLVQVAVALGMEGGRLDQVRIALGAVAPVPLRAGLAETALTDLDYHSDCTAAVADAAEIAAGECDPISDHRASAEYRRDMVRVLTGRLIAECLDDLRRGGNGGAA
ncbi:FAD binding domain-containing protein [bacterium]|nr:FAD binding domain-containing protein [bacterium]